MTLPFTQDHRVKGKVELVQSFCCKVVWRTQMFEMVDYVRKMAVKKSCTYGEYGSFDHLLFLFSFRVSNARTYVISRVRSSVRHA